MVYKVDRLTRSLADFAKLVELFDAHQVSFVSVTQAFNTTTSMGRLTLNVLLSFAQFEREVTSERIRDKIGASKKQGPVGRRHGAAGLCQPGQEAGHRRGGGRAGAADLPALSAISAAWTSCCGICSDKGIVTKVRQLSNGRTMGGIPFTRGPLAYLLRNRFYIGEVVYRGTICPAEHEPILDRELFEAVQAKLTEQQSGSARRGTPHRRCCWASCSMTAATA